MLRVEKIICAIHSWHSVILVLGISDAVIRATLEDDFFFFVQPAAS